ncbi:hypothetical protein CRE_26562 [Caenorhabditis remanei]|uniref:F-box domain-containing protein n=1 Tax=Caenorhabditis remanei TaxID=31234 RepID=E3LRA2_CAERE|nr:hypothetical protein CRE_26562 [Caenorhabditis remanei]
MQLLSFPALIQKEIFGNLHFDGLLILSFCSKRMRNVIQCLQKHRIKNLKTITYYFTRNDRISIVGKSCDSILLKLNLSRSQDVICMDVFGMGREIPLWLTNLDYWCFTYNYRTEQKNIIIEGVHAYLLQFFESSVQYRVESDSSKLPPSLKHIHSSVYELPKNTTAEELEECFVSSPNQEYVSIYLDFACKISPKSIIYGIENLHVACFDYYNDHILFHFRGKSLIMETSAFKNITIIRFLEAWKSNQGFETLVFLSIGSPYLDRDKIHRATGVKQSTDVCEIKWKERSVSTSSTF